MKVSIKALRVNANLNQKEAAKSLGIAPVTLIKWESNKTSPTVEQLVKMCNLYGCTVDDIFLPESLTKS